MKKMNKKNTKNITILSGKGGTGKTTPRGKFQKCETNIFLIFNSFFKVSKK